MELLSYQGFHFSMQRFPLKKEDRLRAWDAADEYLLRHLTQEELLAPDSRILLLNDAFGALAVPLHRRQPVSWGDSHLARLARKFNLYHNDIEGPEPPFVPADEDPVGPFDVVLIKLPKNLAFFEDQLLRLRPLLAPEARVVTGGMIKHTPKRVYQLLETILGTTVTTQGWKKARLALSELDSREGLPACLPPTTFTLPGSKMELCSLPNVFSREKPDVGTRLLLDNLPATESALSAIDLGCGNGILAVALSQSCPQARILGVDESYQAIASAKANAVALALADDHLEFRVGDGLTDEPGGTCDLVICNPPFHQGMTTGDLAAWTMFAEAERVLRPGGELRVVGNRHLGYHAKLQRLFDQVELLASDPKFVVLSAIKNSNVR